MLKIKSPAKVNLFLHITGKTRDGYHLLDSLVVFAEDIYDEITIEEANANSVIFSGPYAHGIPEHNTVTKALELLNLPTKFKITINKQIPTGAGLGGGSSNAGTLIKHFKDTAAASKSLSIGADVPLFLNPTACYFNGIGEVISPIRKFPDNIFLVIVYPNISVETQAVYRMGFSTVHNELHHKMHIDSTHELLTLLANSQNDLYANALKVSPAIEGIIKEIGKTDGCMTSRMSGSGSSCYGLFTNKTDAHTARALLSEKFPSYFVQSTKVR